MSGERPGEPAEDVPRDPSNPPPPSPAPYPSPYPPPTPPYAGQAPPGPPPPGYPTFPPPAPRRPVAKHLILGALLGLVAGIGMPVAFLQLDAVAGGTGALFFLGFLVPLGLAIGLTVAPRTRLLGAGMFIGFGVALIVGAGVCIALLAQLNAGP